MSRRAGEILVVVAIVALAGWLRVVHLGTPSLWWDELVEIATADRPLADTLRIVRDGVGPGSGNGGAMPADYVLLNGYLAAVPRPAPGHLETYFRAPACAASIAAVVALYLVARSLFGRGTAALAALLLTTSLPAILYAAEARPYSLMTLATVLDLAAFVAVVRRPRALGAWGLYVAAGLFYVASGVFGVLVVGVQYLVLSAIAMRERGPSLGIVVTSAVAMGLAVANYLGKTPLAVVYPRQAVVEPLAVSWASLRFFAADGKALLVAFLVAVPFFLRAARSRDVGPVAMAVVLAFAAIPAIAVAIRWKHYYFHVRHVIFLLPLFHLVLAAGVLELLQTLDVLREIVGRASVRRALDVVAAAALVLAITGPSLRAFVALPQPSFARTKTLRDLGPLTRDVAASVARLPPGERYLLLAERNTTANTMLSAYLQWYGLGDRVTFRAPGVPLDQIEPVLHRDGGDPRGLALRPAHGIYFALRALVRQEAPIGDVPARVTAVGIVGWTTPQSGPDVRRYWNVTLRERGVPPPSRPRS